MQKTVLVIEKMVALATSEAEEEVAAAVVDVVDEEVVDEVKKAKRQLPPLPLLQLQLQSQQQLPNELFAQLHSLCYDLSACHLCPDFTDQKTTNKS